MTRTGRSPRLSQHLAEPFVEIHPEDARRHGIGDADIVRVTSAQGAVLVRALLSRRQSPGSVFVPMHWNDQFASSARIDRLVPAVTDPHSGQPAFKHVAVGIERFPAGRYGFAVLGEKPPALDSDYWVLAICQGGWRLELGLADDDRDWNAFATALFAGGGEKLAYHDETAGDHRFAWFDGERLVGALFLAAKPVVVSRDWACAQLLKPHIGQRARLAVLAGRPSIGIADPGPIVCSCFGIGSNQIGDAILEGCVTVEEIGKLLHAGTSCGSCQPEIKKLIATMSEGRFLASV